MKRKIGILGLGSIGKRHLKNFKELGCKVRGFDPDLAGEGLDDRLLRPEILEWADAVVVASPTMCHYDDIMDCTKPMLVEKPIVGSVSQWNKVPLDKVVMVGYNLRFHSCVKEARKWLGSGVIGKPLWARFTCAQHNNREVYHRDGVVLNWSHELDLALYLLGAAEVVAAATTSTVQGNEDTADIILRHRNIGCQTAVHLDYNTKWERRGFLIVGEYGSIEADLVTRQLLRRNNTGTYTDTFYGRDSFDGNFLDEARKFLDRLDGKEAIGCTAKEAMDVVDICLQAKRLSNEWQTKNGSHRTSPYGVNPVSGQGLGTLGG